MSETLQFKIIFLGDSNVGKTSFITRFTEDTFNESHITTIGIDYRIKNLVKDDKKVKLQVWDTAGQERYRSVAKSQYNTADGIMLLYDISNKTTFNQISHWLNDIKDKCSEHALIILIGNKCDLPEDQRAVTQEDGQKLAKKKSIGFFESSAKTKYNVDNIMNYVTEQILSKSSNKRSDKDEKKKELVNNSKISSTSIEKKSFC